MLKLKLPKSKLCYKIKMKSVSYLLLVNFVDVLSDDLHSFLFSRHGDLVLHDRVRGYIDLDIVLGRELINIFVVWSADEWMVYLGHGYALIRQLGLKTVTTFSST